jgi:hypothetical protein
MSVGYCGALPPPKIENSDIIENNIENIDIINSVLPPSRRVRLETKISIYLIFSNILLDAESNDAKC